MRVWFSGRTSAFQADGAGSIPATRSIFSKAICSCSSGVEHFLGKEEVASSILAKSSIYYLLSVFSIFYLFLLSLFINSATSWCLNKQNCLLKYQDGAFVYNHILRYIQLLIEWLASIINQNLVKYVKMVYLYRLSII